MPGRIGFEFGFARPGPQRQPAAAGRQPTRILLMGDFSGRHGDRPAAGPLEGRTLHPLDLDTIAPVLQRLRPRIEVAGLGEGGSRACIEIQDMDDFHPDALFGKLEMFHSLRELRQRLLDPATFAQAAAEMAPSAAPAAAAPEGADAAPGPAEPAEDDDATLARLLGREASSAAPPASPAPSRAGRSPGRIDPTDFIRDLVAPYIVPEADPRQEVYVAVLDAAIGDQMRALLHQPVFQAMEAAWRGLHWLVTELETGEDLQLFICDVTRDELVADLCRQTAPPEESALHRLLVEQESGTPGGHTWSVMVGDFHFGHSAEDVRLLSGLGAIAERAGAPFLAGATSGTLGCPSLLESPDPADWRSAPADDERWLDLRRSPQASWLGLALPRILLRLPYGSGSDPIESFPFEEMTALPAHESFLWGNPAFACALLLGRALPAGEAGQAQPVLLLDGLPAFIHERDGSRVMKPCAEVLLGERACQQILARGLIPLLSHRDRNAVSVPGLHSLAVASRSLDV
jgi:type VI secretion system protein ImpC